MLNDLELELFSIPLDFSAVTVDLIEHYISLIEQLHRQTYDQIAAMREAPEQMSFSTVVQPLINLQTVISKAESICVFPKEVHVEGAVREASAEASKKIENLAITCNQRDDVFQVLRDYAEGVFKTEQAELSHEKSQYVNELLLKYKRRGLFIEDALLKARITEINQKISALSIDFCHNVSEDNTSFIINKSDLTGLPEAWFTPDREVSPGQYKVTLKYPDLNPILDYAENRRVREKIFLAFNQRAEMENLPKLKEILTLRNELAQILGYKTYADYAAEDRMAATSSTIKAFLDEMNDRFTPLLEENLQALTTFARKKEQDPSFQLQHYDMRYYMRLREEAIAQIDLQQLKQYFPPQKVIAGTLQVYERLLGLQFIERENPSRWHSDVSYYDVYSVDGETREPLGGFYLDLYPREGKYSHAEACPLQNGCDISSMTDVAGERQLGFAAMVCNFPQDENLEFEDVVTFFHEFGHLMHFICAKPELEPHAADFTATDFVEAPSQMLERWCYEPSVLPFLSEHMETKLPLPSLIAQQLKEQDKIHAGYFYKRQMSYAFFDFLVHSLSAEELESLDLKQFFNQTLSKITQLPALEAACTPASFEHIVGGYDVGYYGYLWSNTYAADMYHTKFQQDPLSQEVGARYRKAILEPGASKKGMDMLTDFLGRAPSTDAFIQSYTKIKPEGGTARRGIGLFDAVDVTSQDGAAATETTMVP